MREFHGSAAAFVAARPEAAFDVITDRRAAAAARPWTP